jgi:hypothetical protein
MQGVAMEIESSAVQSLSLLLTPISTANSAKVMALGYAGGGGDK